MNIYIFFITIAFFAGLYLFIGKRISSKVKSCEEYFLGKRKFSFFAIAMTLLATQLGGGALIGAADAAYQSGWSVLFYPLGMSLGLIFLSFGFGKGLKKLKINTVAQIFEKKYGSINLKKIASFLSIITLFFILVSQGIAARKFFLSIGIEHFSIFFIFTAAVVLYTTFGGLKGVVKVDIIQMIFVVVTLGIVFFLTLKTGSGAIVASSSNATISFYKNNFWISWFLMPFLFMVIEQDMGQRCFAAKNSKTFLKAGIISAIILFACSSIAIYFGVLAKKMGIEIGKSGALMTVISATSNPIITAFFAAALLMVIISTADSLLCSIASNVAFDFSFFKNNEKKRLLFAKIVTFTIGSIAICLSFYFNNVLFMLIKSYSLSVCILFVPIAMAILSEKFPKLQFSKAACIASMIIGSVAFLFFEFYPAMLSKEIIVLFLSLLGFFGTESILRIRKKVLLD